MTRIEFENKIEAAYPDVYFFLTIDAWDAVAESLSRTYAYQKALFTPETIQKMPPLSIQRVFLADYILSDGEVKKDRNGIVYGNPI